MVPILLRASGRISVLGLISENFVHTIEYASRLCYGARDKMMVNTWYDYIKARVRSGHESVIEHNMISMIIHINRPKSSDIDDMIISLNQILNDSNTMLRFVDESEGFSFKPGETILSISGNIKMWRDLFKYISETKENNYLLMLIAKIFKYFDGADMTDAVDGKGYPIGLKGLFTSDIPYFNQIDASLTCDDFIELCGNRRTDAFSDPSRIKEIDTGDEGIRLSIINIDDPIFSVVFNPEIKSKISETIISFIKKHVKDLGSITYEVTMPRIITQQESRHRINSISQMSQRYINEGDSPNASEFYQPKNIDCDKEYNISIKDKEINISYNEFNELARKLYIALFTDKVPKETARFVLTNGIYSSMVVTKPFHTLDHYFKERTSDRAQYEIRIVAKTLKEYINNNFKSSDSLANYGLKPLFK